jgi:hypothetical protein
MNRLHQDERGGAHVALFALLALVFAVILLVTAVDWMLLASGKTRMKLALDRAVHAASLHIDPVEAAYGRLVWEEEQATAAFEQILRLNLGLSEAGEPLPGSPLERPPVIHVLEFVTSPTYPAVLERSVTIDPGTEAETVRNIKVTIYGPSVAAVMEVHHTFRGKTEPIVLSSAANVRFR